MRESSAKKRKTKKPLIQNNHDIKSLTFENLCGFFAAAKWTKNQIILKWSLNKSKQVYAINPRRDLSQFTKQLSIRNHKPYMDFQDRGFYLD